MLDLTIITGYPKTGTSILFQCLEKSGLNGGPGLMKMERNNKHLESEDAHFHHMNVFLAKTIGYTPFKGKQGPWDFYVERQNGFEFKLPINLIQGINTFQHYLRQYKIDLLKDASGLFGIKWLYANIKDFKFAKYIFMTRDIVDASKSFVRQKCKLYPTSFCGGWLTTKKVIKINKFYIKELEEFKQYPGINYYELSHERLINHTGSVAEGLSEFLQTPVDLSLIDKKKVWHAERQKQAA